MKMNKEVVMVRLSDIIPNRFQPRLTFDEDALNELANSIKEHGIIQPLILRDLGSKYEIIAGERRYKASTIAGLTEVPAIVGSMDDQTSAELALIENIQRKDLSAIEEAKSYKKILEMGNFTQDELAKRMGKSQSTVANKMRLLSLTNEVQVALMNNLISERHARCLLQVKDEDKQKEVLNKVIAERMNVRATDDYIKDMLGISRTELPKEEPAAYTPVINDVSSNVERVDVVSEIASPVIPSVIDIPKAEETVPVPPAIEVPEEKTISTTPVDKVQNENPNVYTQTDNLDFVNISNLNNDEIVPNNPVKSALKDLDISNNTDSFDSTNTLEEEKEVLEMPNNTQEQNNNLSKVKLATAIKLAKNSIDEIKNAGYTVKVEEIDGPTDYQIIIKVQK